MSGIFTIAVHAMVYLNRRGETVSSEELAKNICTNPARVRKVMAMLHRAGLIQTHTGARGGYSFHGDPAAVTLQAVCQAVEDPPVPKGWRSGETNTPCMIASGMAGAMDQIRVGLNEVCLLYLKNLTITDVNRMIFQDGIQEGGCR